jgi:hypothetical protein
VRRPTLQPSYVPPYLRLAAQESWCGHHDHQGLGQMGITGDGAEIYKVSDLEDSLKFYKAPLG